MTKLYVPLIKGYVSPQFRQFSENWYFDGISTGADLTKIVKFCTALNCDKENIFWLNYMFPSSKEVFPSNLRQFLENWFFDRNSTGADFTKIVKFCTALNCDKEIFFLLNYMFPSSKEVFQSNLRQFLEIWFFDGNSTGADLTKIVKILYYLKLW